jgi:TPR repeat protein
LGLGFTAGVVYVVAIYSSKERQVNREPEDSTPASRHLSEELVREADQIVFDSSDTPDWSRVASLLKSATALGNPEAALKLGHCHLEGRGLPKNARKAVELFRQSAEAGYPEGQYNLAVSYAKGTGIERNEEEMLKWLVPAADQEVPEAMDALGLRYLIGVAVPMNESKGFDLIAKAAEKGLASSQYRLSLCYELGQGVNADNLQAYR